MYINSILWLLSWPILVYGSYLAVLYMITRYEKKGIFKTETKEEIFRE